MYCIGMIKIVTQFYVFSLCSYYQISDLFSYAQVLWKTLCIKY